MIRSSLRRFGLAPVVIAVTLLSIAASSAIALGVHWFVLNETMTPVAWALTLGCPALIAPTMSWQTFSLLLQLDRAHEQLRVLSITDALTGAANRRHFMAQLQREIERGGPAARPFSVALIDVDDFKAVNDRHGHLAGDEVLRRLAAACMAQVRAGDTFARFGGEEFAVLLPDTSLDEALQWLERLRQHVAQLVVELPAARIAVTVSVGLATVRRATAPIDAALREADDALYRAKREGKNRIVPSALAA